MLDNNNNTHTHNLVPLIVEGKSMNSIFGDPCPGTTKILRLQYHDDRRELCRASFFEHEQVVILKRKTTYFQEDVETLKKEEAEDDEDDVTTDVSRKRLARRHRSCSIAEFEEVSNQGQIASNSHDSNSHSRVAFGTIPSAET